MVVKLQGSSSTDFNVLPPGSDEAIFIGSTLGNTFEGALPAKGKYTIRVYQMGSAAKSSKAHAFTLEVGISG